MTKIDYDGLVARCRENLRAGRDITDGLSAAEAKALRTRYSHFEDRAGADKLLVGSEVVVTALRPPRPYVHMMASNHTKTRGLWGSFWDNTRGGFCCLDSVLAGKMSSHLDTNYVPTSPEIQDVRDFWVHEGGRAWPMFPVPGYEERSYSLYRCRMGLDTYNLSARRAGLDAELSVHVPVSDPLEVWQVTLTNVSAKPRKLAWFARLRVNLDSYPAYYFCPRVVCEGKLEDGALVFLNHDQNNKHPRQSFLTAEPAFDGFDMMSEVFDGWSPRAPIPAAAARGACFNSLGLQPTAGLVAAVQFNAELAPHESKTWTIVYGVAPYDATERAAVIERVRRGVLADPAASRGELAACWEGKVRASAIDTPDRELNRYFNVWSKLQSKNMSRFCHALDKIGYRDILQHVMGVCDFEPAMARARIAQAMQYQFPDGRAVRQFEVFPEAGLDTRMYQDSPVWIPGALTKYVKETGDMAFLDERVPWLDEDTMQPSEMESATVFQHAVRGLESIFTNTGFHGLCKIGYGDWNDALSRIGGEKGVSIWLSCACVVACKQMAELADFLRRDGDAGRFRSVAKDLTERINARAWDGQWYIYAINRDGEPIGSARCAEGKIHLNVNTWAIFSGVAAAAGREEQVWKAIEQLSTPVGHALMDPPYTLASRKDVGRIADMVPGQFENGSVYTHGESFYLYALVARGRSDAWATALPRTLPSCLVPDIATGPPHQQSNYAVGRAHPAFGMNLFNNFTGSLSWYRNGIELVCGVTADYAGLRIDPRPPSGWNKYRVVKSFRGCKVSVNLRRGKASSIRLNGAPVEAELIPAEKLPSGGEAVVDVVYV